MGQMAANIDPLSSREGMIGEVLETAKAYPYLVVVTCTEFVEALQKTLAVRSEQDCEAFQDRIRLPDCDIVFVQELEVEKFGGNVPVFYDPGPTRKAA